MKRPALVRRREVWLPTVWGWLVIAVLVVAGGLFVARNLHGFLAVRDPVAARVLIVEGWMGPRELEETAAIVRGGGYERVIATGGPIVRWPSAAGPSTFAEQAAWYLAELGVPKSALVAVPAPTVSSDRTYLSALTVRDWAERRGERLEAFNIVSAGPHARRTRLLYRRVFGPEVSIGVIATRSYDYDAERWWQSSAGAKEVIDETIGVAWTRCCFRFRRGP